MFAGQVAEFPLRIENPTAIARASIEVSHPAVAAQAFDVPAGAGVANARLHLERTEGNNQEADTLRVQAWRPPELPPFDDRHAHGPEGFPAYVDSPWIE